MKKNSKRNPFAHLDSRPVPRSAAEAKAQRGCVHQLDVIRTGHGEEVHYCYRCQSFVRRAV